MHWRNSWTIVPLSAAQSLAQTLSQTWTERFDLTVFASSFRFVCLFGAREMAVNRKRVVKIFPKVLQTICRHVMYLLYTWLRRLLRVTRRDKMRNETVRGILCQETTLVDRIAKRRLNWFGHVPRMGRNGCQQRHYTAAISMGKETK